MKVLKLFEKIFFLVCLIIIGISIFSLIEAKRDPDNLLTVLNYMPAVVRSGSMVPSIQLGDMVISKVVGPNDIKIGDVISYRTDNGIPIIHRVVGLIEKDGKILFETKGDANDAKDSMPVPQEKVIGRFVYKVSRVGYVVQFIKTRAGFFLVIIVPIMLVSAIEFRAFYIEYKNKRKKIT